MNRNSWDNMSAIIDECIFRTKGGSEKTFVGIDGLYDYLIEKWKDSIKESAGFDFDNFAVFVKTRIKVQKLENGNVEYVNSDNSFVFNLLDVDGMYELLRLLRWNNVNVISIVVKSYDY